MTECSHVYFSIMSGSSLLTTLVTVNWLWIILWSFAAEDVCSQSVFWPHRCEAPQWDDPTNWGPRDAVGDGPGARCHSHHHHSHRYPALQEVSLISQNNKLYTHYHRYMLLLEWSLWYPLFVCFLQIRTLSLHKNFMHWVFSMTRDCRKMIKLFFVFHPL